MCICFWHQRRIDYFIASFVHRPCQLTFFAVLVVHVAVVITFIVLVVDVFIGFAAGVVIGGTVRFAVCVFVVAAVVVIAVVVAVFAQLIGECFLTFIDCRMIDVGVRATCTSLQENTVVCQELSAKANASSRICVPTWSTSS